MSAWDTFALLVGKVVLYGLLGALLTVASVAIAERRRTRKPVDMVMGKAWRERHGTYDGGRPS